jgi:hypothetical protein
MNTQLIRKRLNWFLWCFSICLLWGVLNFFLTYTALEYAKTEIPDATFRQVRFNLIEVNAPEYHNYKLAADVMTPIGKLLGCFTFGVWVLYIGSLGYSRKKTILWVIAMFLPIINLFVLLYSIQKGRALINSTPFDAD